jgi:TonB family protein
MKAPDKWPTFKGKDANAFSSWVTSRLKYPKDAKDAHVDGTVLVKFVVGTNGGIQEVEVEKGVFPSLDAEAVRVIKSSPKWKPGIKDGKPIRVTYTHPVIFVIPE